ncbi:uncharacterized protein LOC135390028 [Ornithodoros turicata]|uniref:uncharacterized protein LOC135390028 n=1 Tax=Ornithodoros turicata TaxID=34597 RepID=UPI0031397B00
MWKLDTLGITDLVDGKTQSHPAQQQFEDYVTFQGDRYQVPLLIKPSCCGVLADNRSIAQTRLLSQLRRLRDHPDLLKEYHDTISEYFLEGHAEKAPEVPQENLYYLPHHAVIRKEAVTTKVRVVFDASSHVSGAPSLNQVLQKGPNINADLLLQLVSFRCYPIILTVDIRKAYLQILIRPEDRDALRFLWPEDLPCPGNPCPQIQEWRMTRVPFGAASSPFLLAATLRHHFDSVQHKYPAATERLRHAFYMDDLIVGATSEEDALQIYREAVTMLQEAGMDLRKWCSNSPTLSRQFCQDGIAYDTVSSQETVKVLGLHWHRPTDEVTFTMNGISSYLANQPITKRTILHGVARIFDPLGYLSPFTIRARLVFQSLWARDQGWDDALQAPHLMQWADWCSELPHLNSIRLPRLLPSSSTSSDGNDEIHVFADASPRAYGAAIYLRTFDPQEQWTASLLLAKARVAPVKSVSLPRLELLACLIAARLAAHARKMPLPSPLRTEFWTDSTVALHWITSAQSRTPVFVQNRVNEIRQLTTDSAWHHCKSRDNPADLLTRGISAHRLRNESLWWHGAPWFSQPRDNWHSEWSDHPPSPPPSTEDAPLPSMCNAASAVRPPPVFSLDRYGTLSQMLRVTAWVARFIKNAHPRKSHNRGPLTASEIAEAELYWIRQVQEEVFHETLALLRRADPLPRSSRLATLRPFLDSDQILRVGGRLAELLDSDSLKHPIILPNT